MDIKKIGIILIFIVSSQAYADNTVPSSKPSVVTQSTPKSKDTDQEMTKEQFKEREDEGVYIREEKQGDDIIIHHDDGQKKVCPYYDPNSANSGPASDLGKPEP